MTRTTCCAMIASLSCLAGSAQAQVFPSQGITLLSHIGLSGFTPVPGNGNSCWGYVSPGGREYALMGLSNQLAIVDITVPTAPVIRATVAHPDNLWADVKTFGNYAYVSTEGSGGIQIINLTNIDAGTATLIGSITGGPSRSHTLAVDEASGFLYLCGANSNGGSLIAYSLANPAAPTLAGQWTAAQGGVYIHEAQVVTYTTGPYAGKQICFANCGGNGLKIVDITNKSAMTLMATNLYPSLNYCHQGWLNADRSLYYMDDEIDGPAEGVPYDLTRIFNVTNLSAPTLVGTFSAGVPGAIDHNQYVLGRYIYQSNYTSGLRVMDAINPLAPVEVAYIDTYPANNGATYDGTWNNYPFLPSGNMFISDIQGGLFVVRLNLDYLTLTYTTTPPTTIPVQTPTPISVDIASSGTALNPATVRLFTSVNNAPFTSTIMSAVDADTFTANLPAAPCLATVRYYVQAANTAGTTFTNPNGAPATFNSAFANPGTTTLSTYDMETAAGWTAGAAGDTATTGLWERGDPEPTAAQPGDDHTAGAGINCWVTGRTAGASVGANDVDGGLTTLLSPTINLATANSETYISYWRWYTNSLGSAANADTFRVDLSNDNGTTWASVEVVGPTSPAPEWIQHTFRVADIRPLTAQMKLRFIADDAGAGSVVEAALDDVTIFTYNCPPPGPTCDSIDFNGDGLFPDTADIDDFLSVFSGGPCSTGTCGDIDFNNDGLLPDTTDIDSFLSVFSGGPCL